MAKHVEVDGKRVPLPIRYQYDVWMQAAFADGYAAAKRKYDRSRRKEKKRAR